MSDTEKVVEKLIEWKNDTSFDGGVWWGYAELSGETSIPVKELKTILKTLLEKKMVEFMTLVDDEGRLRGKGYFITDID